MSAWDVQFVTWSRNEVGEWRLHTVNDALVTGWERDQTLATFLVGSGADGWELVSFQFVPSRSLLRTVSSDPGELSVLAGRPLSPPREEQLHGGNLVMVLKRPRAADNESSGPS